MTDRERVIARRVSGRRVFHVPHGEERRSRVSNHGGFQCVRYHRPRPSRRMASAMLLRMREGVHVEPWIAASGSALLAMTRFILNRRLYWVEFILVIARRVSGRRVFHVPHGEERRSRVSNHGGFQCVRYHRPRPSRRMASAMLLRMREGVHVEPWIAASAFGLLAMTDKGVVFTHPSPSAWRCHRLLLC